MDNPFDQFDSPAATGATSKGNPFDKFDGASETQPTPPADSGTRFTDYLKAPLAAVVEGIGHGVSGIGSLGKLVAPAHYAGQIARAEGASPSVQKATDTLSTIADMPQTALQWVGNKITQGGQWIANTESDAAKEAEAKPVVEGQLLHPSTWKLGEGATSPSALALKGLSLAGGIAPMLVAPEAAGARVLGAAGRASEAAGEAVNAIRAGTALSDLSPEAAQAVAPILKRMGRVKKVAAAGVGGPQMAEGAARGEQARIEQMPDDELAKLPAVQAAVANGMTLEQARAHVAQEAHDAAFAATIGPAVGTAFLSALPLVNDTQGMLSKVVGQSRLARGAAGAALEAPVQGAAFTGQQAATIAGTNLATGENRSPLDNSAATFGSGALMGGLFGLVGGLHRPLPAGPLGRAADTARATGAAAPEPYPGAAPGSLSDAANTLHQNAAPAAEQPTITRRVPPPAVPWINAETGEQRTPTATEVVAAFHRMQDDQAQADANNVKLVTGLRQLSDAWGVPLERLKSLRNVAINERKNGMTTADAEQRAADVDQQQATEARQQPDRDLFANQEAASAGEPASSTPPVAGEATAGIPFMITNGMRANLAARGYDRDAISRMTPQDAHVALANPVPRETTEVPSAEAEVSQPTPPSAPKGDEASSAARTKAASENAAPVAATEPAPGSDIATRTEAEPQPAAASEANEEALQQSQPPQTSAAAALDEKAAQAMAAASKPARSVGAAAPVQPDVEGATLEADALRPSAPAKRDEPNTQTFPLRQAGTKGLVVQGIRDDVRAALRAGGFKKSGTAAKDGVRFDAIDRPAIERALGVNVAASEVDAAARGSAAHPENERPEPTPAQHEAGNFKMGHVNLHGLDVTIEIPKGGMRRGTDAQGKPWERPASDHYGYVRRTEGADGEQVDVYLGPHAEDPKSNVFVIDQVKPGTKTFDESKAMIGFKTGREARASYDANFPKGLKTFGGIRKMSMDEFKDWVKNGDTTEPVTDKVAVPAPKVKAEAIAEPALKEGDTVRITKGGFKGQVGTLGGVAGKDLRNIMVHEGRKAGVHAIHASAIERSEPSEAKTEKSNTALFSRTPEETTATRRERGLPASVQEPLAAFRNDQPLKRDPDYKAAKAGDAAAGARLVKRLAGPLVAKARAQFGDGTIYVAPHAEEMTGNKIPQQLAEALAAGTHGSMAQKIVQTNRTFHTGGGMIQSLTGRPEFDGNVVKGGKYVLVDDVSTSGGTFADLADYIQRKGGNVVGAVSLTNAARGGRVAAKPHVLRQLEARHGDVIREQFGIEPRALTAEEASYLAGFRSADEIRNRVASARQERGRRLRAEGVQELGAGSSGKVTPKASARDETTYGSGIPQGLQTRATRAVLSLERQYNLWAHLDSAHGLRIRELRRTDLPDDLGGALATFERVTGTQVHIVRNLTPDVDRFNGITFRDGHLYVDESSQHPVLTTASHEFTHQLQRNAPELYRQLEDEVRRQGKMGEWERVLQSRARGETVNRDLAAQELTANAVGDAMSDPAFLNRMAERNPGAFKELAQRFIAFINRVLAHVLDTGSNRYLTDVAAFRDKLAEVLDAYSRGEKPKPIDLGEDAAAFDRGNARKGDTFYSALTRSIEVAEGAPRKADAAKWKQWLDGAQRRGAFKGAEREWMGLDQWLDELKGPITREGLVEHVRDNQVRMQEKMLADDVSPDRASDIVEDQDGNFVLQGDEGERAGSTKFGEYTLPGGNNYRELLLTLPRRDPLSPTERAELSALTERKQTADIGLRAGAKPLNEVERERLHSLQTKVIRDLPNTFHSNHFDEPNIVAHVRMNDRTGPDGEKILHVEEVQSDLHQIGRKKGYIRPGDKYSSLPHGYKVEPQAPDDGHPRFAVFNPLGDRVTSRHATEAEAIGEALDRLNREAPGLPGVPDAPFKKEWPLLAMKRVLRYAAEHGYDKVTWTTGEQQADRFDLSKRVRSIAYQKNGDGTYKLTAQVAPGRGQMFGEAIPAAKLEDYVGKDVAERIRDGQGNSVNYAATNEPRNEFRELKGADLKIGGAGMRSFYDKTLPNEVAKYVKKWDAKVGETNIGIAGGKPTDHADFEAYQRAQKERAIVHSVDITPAMRESVMQGQPMFSRRPATEENPADPSREPHRAVAAIESAIQSTAAKDAWTKMAKDWLRGRFEDARPWLLKVAPLDRLVELAQEVEPLKVGATQFARSAKQMATDREHLLTGAPDAKEHPHDMLQRGVSPLAEELRAFAHGKGIGAFRGEIRPEAKRTFKLMHEATTAGVYLDGPYERLKIQNARGDRLEWTPELRKERLGLMDELAMQRGGDPDSNREKLREEKKYLRALPRLEAEHKAAYGRLKPQFDALPEEAKRNWRQTRDWFQQFRDEVEKTAIKRIERATPNEASRRAAIEGMRLMYEEARVDGVYFPLARHGDYWIAYTTKGGKSGFEMQEDANAQHKRERQLRAAGNRIDATGLRTKKAKAKEAPSGTFVRKAMDMLAKNGVSEATRDELYQLYLQMLPEMSMRKHALHRDNVIGWSEDVPRTFADNGFHGAYQLARMRHSQDMELALEAAGIALDNWRKSNDRFPGSSAPQLERFMSDTLDRYDADPGAAQAAAAKVDSGGLALAIDDIARRIASEKTGKQARVESEVWNGLAKRWSALPDNVRRAYTLEAMQQFGLHGEHSTFDVAKADTLLGAMKNNLDWVMNPEDAKWANKVTQVGFLYYLGMNPASALTNLTQIAQTTLPVLGAEHGWPKASRMVGAAWRDAARTLGHMDKTLTDPDEKRAFLLMQKRGDFSRTQGHTLAALAEGNRLRSAPAWAKVADLVSYLFHTSEVINREATGMAAFRLARSKGMDFEKAVDYAGRINASTQFDYSAQNRAPIMRGSVARIAFQFKNFAIQQSFLVGRNMWLATDAFHRWLADNLGPDAARLIAEGPTNYLTGANVASRTSLSNLWMHDNNQRLEGADAYHALLESLAGPVFGGIVPNLYTGTEDVRRGYVWRGVERMLPAAAKNSLKALRYAHEGVNSLRGDPIVPDVSGYEDFLQAIGFQPAAVANQYRVNTAIKNYTGEIKDRRTTLMNAYALAVKSGDAENRGAAVAAIHKFNTAHPEVAITVKTLSASLRARARRSAQAMNGVVLDRKLALRALQYAGVQ